MTERTTIILDKQVLDNGIAFAKSKRVSLSIVLETLLKELLNGNIKVAIPLETENHNDQSTQ